MKGTATALKSGDNVYISIPKAITRAENIKPGNLVEFDITNPKPDYVVEKKRGYNFKKKKASSIPEELIIRLLSWKKSGKTLEEIKASFEIETDYSWEDLPEQIIKELSA